MTPEERRQFVLDHRTAIFGYNRAQHRPAMSIVFYCAEPEEIVVLTMAARAKAKAVARDPKVSLCVLDEQWPPSYLQVYCDAEIDTDFEFVVDVMMRIAGAMAGRPISEDVRPMVEEGAGSRMASPCACGRTRPSIRRPAMCTARRTSDPFCCTRPAPRSLGEEPSAPVPMVIGGMTVRALPRIDGDG